MNDPPPRSRAAAPLVVDIVHEAGGWDDFGDVEGAIRAAADVLAAAPELQLAGTRNVAIALADDAMVMALNHQFRGKAKPTNVLSFPAGGADPAFLGDIVFACETIRAESIDLDVPPLHHVQHLTVHGLLHLLGHDHETDADAERMERLETTLLARLGVADPYADSEPIRTVPAAGEDKA